VTIKAKRTNGKIDIQFKDGEFMRSVLPRIQRESVPDHSAEKSEKDASCGRAGGGEIGGGDAAGAQQATSSTSTVSSSGHPKTARSPSSTGTSKMPPLPPATSPIDQARAGNANVNWAAGAAYGLGSVDRQAPSLGSATSPLASGVIAVAANVIAGKLANIDVAAASSSPATTASTPVAQDDEGLSNLSPLGFMDCMQKQPSRSSNGSGGVEPTSRGCVPEPLPVAVSPSQQVQPSGNLARGTGLRPPAAPPGTSSLPNWTTIPAPDANRVHEVRLRNHLQQLISVRPIVTRRKAGGLEDAPKSPRIGSRRQSGNTSGSAYAPLR
jgi:hypothetical protein